jgi:tetratricopeptide (TPR) repeat protein
MEHKLERRWSRARGHEASGNPAAATLVYQSIVQMDPSQVDAWLRLSKIQQASGHYRAGLAYARRAAASVAANGAWKHLAAVSLQLLHFNELGQARDLIASADWSTPDVIRQSPSLSQHLWLSGHPDEALRMIDAASRRILPNHLLSYSRANALRHSGRLDEATSEYERCIELAPNYAPAHWSLAYHQPAQPRGSRVARIHSAIAASPPDSLDQADLYYALFKELDDLGDTDAAWDALQRGAAIKRRSLRYDSRRQHDALRAIRERKCPALRQVAASSRDRHVPIFIVGMPRTGTTLLERLLGGHSQVASAGELNDFASALSWESDHFYAGADDPLSVAKLLQVDFADVGARYLQRTAHHRGPHAFVIDKNPANFLNAEFIAQALPDAKIICMIRNPMDACFSNLKELFAGDAYPYSYDLVELADHYDEFLQTVAHWQAVLGARFLAVHYEELVQDPAAVARATMAFCGLPYEEGCIHVERNLTPVATASSSQVRQPIHARFLDAWKPYSSQLSALQQRLQENAPIANDDGGGR